MSVRTKAMNPSGHEDVLSELKLKKPSKLELKIAVSQFAKAKRLNSKRKENGMQLLGALKNQKLVSNYADIEAYDSPFVKFYAYNEKFDSYKNIPALNKKGVEAKHLEQMFNNQVQERFVSIDQQELTRLPNYNKIHDNLISLPLTEGKMDVEFIVNQVVELTKKGKQTS
jgi:dTDP-4-amino-4,6-dideoxygalactose transaminase